jgi:hypothetical protein
MKADDALVREREKSCGRKKDTPAATNLPLTMVDGLPENLSHNQGRNADSAVE